MRAWKRCVTGIRRNITVDMQRNMLLLVVLRPNVDVLGKWQMGFGRQEWIRSVGLGGDGSGKHVVAGLGVDRHGKEIGGRGGGITEVSVQ